MRGLREIVFSSCSIYSNVRCSSDSQFGGVAWEDFELEAGFVRGWLLSQVEEWEGGRGAKQLNSPVEAVRVMAAKYKGEPVAQWAGNAAITEN